MEEFWSGTEDAVSGTLDVLGDAVGSVTGFFTDGIGAIISNFFYSILYKIATGLCWVVNVLDQMFGIMSGLDRVSYNGKQDYLINVFFGNSTISNVYWGMALIGILLCFVFAIIAVARKAADSGDKIRQSLGGILTGMFKGIIIIVSLTAIMSMVLTISDVLLRQVSYLFDNADNLDKEDSIVFDNEEYAAMARVLDTIGNYSLNPSYNSRYNLNRCFNEIRSDLQYLKQRGVFSFYYVEDKVNGESWQSALQKIVNAADLDKDLNLDIYNESVAKALTSCMTTMRTDYSFKPLQSYKRQYTATTQTVPIDRLIFLMSTMDAAKNSDYNKNASMQDSLRGAYYVGEKSFYDLSTVNRDFELGDINYVVLYMVAFKMIWDLAVIIVNCVARLFNMVFLYVIAPPFIATMPLDDGGKLKQWTTAFTVQCFSVFGSIIAMRVLLLFIPIVIDSKLVLLSDSTLNLLAKMILILGGMSTAKRASGVITGILADNAGMQAINAGDMGESVRQGMNNGRNYFTGMGQTSWGRNSSTWGMGKGKQEKKEKKAQQKKERAKEKAEAKEKKESAKASEKESEAKAQRQAEKKQWRADMLSAARGERPGAKGGKDSGGGGGSGGGGSGGDGGNLPKNEGGGDGGKDNSGGGSGGGNSDGGSGGGSGGDGGNLPKNEGGNGGDGKDNSGGGAGGENNGGSQDDGGNLPQKENNSGDGKDNQSGEGKDGPKGGAGGENNGGSQDDGGNLPKKENNASDGKDNPNGEGKDGSGGGAGGGAKSGSDQQFKNVFGVSKADYDAKKSGGGEGKDGSGDGAKSSSDQQFQNVFGVSKADYDAKKSGGGSGKGRRMPPPPRSKPSAQASEENPLPNKQKGPQS